MNNSNENESNLLRSALIGNGIFSTVSGTAFIIGAKPLAAFAGIDTPWIIIGIGVSLLFFAVGLIRNARREHIHKGEATMAIAMDFLWVFGSAIIIALGILSTGGNWGTAIVADIVLIFAVIQSVGLRRLKTKNFS
jgi:hypothetical protein